MSLPAKIFTGEYYEINDEVFVFARVGAHCWNLVSVTSGQPYSETPYEDIHHKWWKEFDERDILLFFGLHSVESRADVKICSARKLSRHEDFIVRVRDYSGADVC